VVGGSPNTLPTFGQARTITVKTAGLTTKKAAVNRQKFLTG
jgi:hypothetical protein